MANFDKKIIKPPFIIFNYITTKDLRKYLQPNYSIEVFSY